MPQGLPRGAAARRARPAALRAAARRAWSRPGGAGRLPAGPPRAQQLGRPGATPRRPGRSSLPRGGRARAPRLWAQQLGGPGVGRKDDAGGLQTEQVAPQRGQLLRLRMRQHVAQRRAAGQRRGRAERLRAGRAMGRRARAPGMDASAHHCLVLSGAEHRRAGQALARQEPGCQGEDAIAHPWLPVLAAERLPRPRRRAPGRV